MNTKITILAALGIVLVASIAISIPQASAVNSSDNAWHYYNQRTHVSDRFNKAQICGDHYCTPGEFAKWEYASKGTQTASHGKMGEMEHGEHVMHKLAGSNSTSTMHMKMMNSNSTSLK